MSELNLDAHWMPFTASRGFKQKPRIITRANGCYFTSDDGREVYDSLSGLWCCGAGHNVPAIKEAIAKQLDELDFGPGFQYGHPGSFALAERVAEFMPEGLNRVFFTNSGSESTETALKIARAYWKTIGQGSKTKLIGRGKAYHGTNFGGMSLGGLGPNRKPFGTGIDADHLPATLLPENAFTCGLPQYGEHLAENLLDIIGLHDASSIAAVIVEPVSGSGGVVVPPQGYLERLREICTEHNILLIFDEVITCFGRVGSKTGAEAFGVKPDIICMAKQLTNGIVPMGAVAVRQDIRDAFLEAVPADHAIDLPHGYTYSSHPVACAAGLASLDHLESAGLIEKSKSLAPKFEEYIHALRGAPNVVDIRNYGLMGAIQLAPRDADPVARPYDAGVAMWENGFYVRWGGDTLQFAPPFTSTAEELQRLFDALSDVLQKID